MAATVWSLERTAGPSKTHWGTIRLFGTILFIGLAACLAIWFTAQLRDRRQRAAFIAILATEQLERLRGFERVKGDWREFRDLLHRRDRQQVDLERMTPSDPMAVAVDWLDAYRAARINQIVGLHSPDAVIECACGGRKIIHGIEAIAAYWRHRFIEMPALELEDLRLDGAAVVVSYRTSGGIVEALLDTASDGRITRCRCGPIGQQAPQ